MIIIDFVLLAIAVAAAVYGVSVGFVRQLGATLGVFAGLVMAAFFVSKLAFFAQDSAIQWTILALLLFTLVLLYVRIGQHIGNWAHLRIERWKHFRPFDKALGGVFAALASVVLLWFAAGMLQRSPVPFIAQQVHNSYLFYALERLLPERPQIFDQVAVLFDSYHFPELFVDSEPRANATPSLSYDLSQVSIAAASSVVKVETLGCNVVSRGSGFIAGDGIVVTNAHVIAGGEQMYVTDTKGASYPAKPVLFDPSNDIAVLYAKGVSGKPLAFGDGNIRNYGSPAVIIGYPGGGALAANQAVIWRRLQATGYDIYNAGKVSRDLFMVAGKVVPGNSGGPLIDQDGKVIGVIIGHSYEQDDVAFALSTDQWATTIPQFGAQTVAVDTGLCQ